MRNTRALCQTAVVAALYVALTTLNPLSWGAIQFRVANMLCALPFKDKSFSPQSKSSDLVHSIEPGHCFLHV